MNIDTFHEYLPSGKSGAAAENLVILMHGYGADGRDMYGIAQEWGPECPKTAFICPDAPLPCEIAPYGYQWFSLQDETRASMEEGIRRMAPAVTEFVAAQAKKFKVPYSRIVLGGFSQGAMMSLFVAPRLPEQIAGVLSFSGAVFGEDDLGTEKAPRKPPAFLYHGDADSLIPSDAWREARVFLERAGIRTTAHLSEGLAHGIDEDGLTRGKAFLKKCLKQ